MTTKKVKKLPVKTLHGKGDVRKAKPFRVECSHHSVKTLGCEICSFADDYSTPKFYKPRKDYTNHLIIAGLTALFLFSAFNGWLSGETFIN
jgi:hypothetical protein